MTFLLNKTTRVYILLGVTLYAILFIYWENSISWYNMLNVFSFAAYAFLLWMSANRDVAFYTSKRLGLTVFVSSLVFVGLYLMMSDYYTGNTFLFSEIDAKAYEKMCLRLLKIPIGEWVPYLQTTKWNYDDWGAPFFITLILKIVPNKLFLNFCFVLLNTLSAIMLFGIGKIIMQTRYAYISSLSYATASYMIFFMGSFLKEQLFVFNAIASMYMLYKYWFSKNIFFLMLGGLTSLLLLLFRVPVALFMWAAYASLLILGSKDKIKLAFFIIIGFVVSFLAYSSAQYSADLYVKGGEVTETYYFQHYNLFQKIVLYMGALIGPFPQMLQIGDMLSAKSIYGAGTLFKLLLFFPFWKGFIYCIREKKKDLYPLFTFVILEMVGLMLVLDGLELRKAIPHVPFFILASFWFMSEYDEDADDEIQSTPYYIWSNREYNVCIIATIIIAIVWNVIRVN